MSAVARFDLTLLVVATTIAALAGFAAAGEWAPPEPEPESLDWVRLSSGEWVRGKIKLLQYEVLSFDSEEMDDLEFDWSDVVEIRSPRILTLGMIDGTIVTGTVVMRDGIVKVRTDEKVWEFESGSILAIIEGRPTEWNFWSLLATGNLVLRSGNTTQDDFGSFLRLRRQTTRSQLNTEFRANYGSLDGETTVRNDRLDVDAKLFLSRMLFVTPVSIDYYSDDFQNLDARSGLGAGFGYYIIRSKTDWQVNAGGGYQRTLYNSVSPGEDRNIGNGTLHLGTTLEMDLTKTVELDFTYSAQRSFGTDANTLHHAYGMLSFDVFGDFLDFTASVTWDHNTNPKANADGVTPRKTDLTMAYGLGIDF